MYFKSETAEIRNGTVLAPFKGRIEKFSTLFESDLNKIGAILDQVGLYQLRKAERQFSRAEKALQNRRPDLDWKIGTSSKEGWKIKVGPPLEVIRPSFVADAYVPSSYCGQGDGAVTIRQKHDKERGETFWDVEIYQEDQYVRTTRGNLDHIFRQIHAVLGPPPRKSMVIELVRRGTKALYSLFTTS